MIRAALPLLALLLGSCDDLPRARSESEIRQISREEALGLQARIIALEERLRTAEEEAEKDRAFLVGTYNDLGELRDVVNSNARQENQRRVDLMNQRGACGTRPCTVEDLRE